MIIVRIKAVVAGCASKVIDMIMFAHTLNDHLSYSDVEWEKAAGPRGAAWASSVGGGYWVFKERRILGALVVGVKGCE